MRRSVAIRILLAAVALGALVVAWGWRGARADPVVRRASVVMPGWPPGEAPLRVVLASDIHIGNRAMNADRLARIVAQINTLRPDLVLLAGDFIAGHEAGDAALRAPALVAPLRQLAPRLATIAVLGNHDHWTGAAAVRDALAQAGVVVIANDARRFGALTVAGVDDIYTGHARPQVALAAARRLGGARLLVSHGPDVVPGLGGDVALVLTGHTHCGQIVLPLWGALTVPSAYGDRYRCGVIREGARATIVTGGLGASVLPLRYGAPPDLWLLTLGGPAAPDAIR